MKQTRPKAKKKIETAHIAPATAFSFGDPIPVLDRRELLEHIECVPMYERWYNPPISFDSLARSFRASPHHSSAIYLKRNLLTSTFIEQPVIITRSIFPVNLRLVSIWQRVFRTAAGRIR